MYHQLERTDGPLHRKLDLWVVVIAKWLIRGSRAAAGPAGADCVLFLVFHGNSGIIDIQHKRNKPTKQVDHHHRVIHRHVVGNHCWWWWWWHISTDTRKRCSIFLIKKSLLFWGFLCCCFWGFMFLGFSLWGVLFLVIDDLVILDTSIDGVDGTRTYCIMIDVASRRLAFAVFATNHTQTTIGNASGCLFANMASDVVASKGTLGFVHRTALGFKAFPQICPRRLVVNLAEVVVQNRTSHTNLVAVRALIRVFGNSAFTLVLALDVHQECRSLLALANVAASRDRAGSVFFVHFVSMSSALLARAVLTLNRCTREVFAWLVDCWGFDRLRGLLMSNLAESFLSNHTRSHRRHGVFLRVRLLVCWVVGLWRGLTPTQYLNYTLCQFLSSVLPEREGTDVTQNKKKDVGFFSFFKRGVGSQACTYHCQELRRRISTFCLMFINGSRRYFWISFICDRANSSIPPTRCLRDLTYSSKLYRISRSKSLNKNVQCSLNQAS